jgi:transaldolase/glucose-6-phosphate isomerase
MVDRPNLMVKIPGTPPGIPAIRESVAAGLNVNITLLFSRQNYERVLDAYMSGLEDRVARHEPIDDLHSVASFFVSRVDAKADKTIDDLLAGERDKAVRSRLQGLRGTLGLANARLVYRRFAESQRTERWHRLAERGGRLQRVLWASTSTKDPSFSDVLYVDGLIAPHTVNTMPLETLEAFIDHGTVRRTADQGADDARERFDEAPRLGVDIQAIVDELQNEGVSLFRQSFDALLAVVDRKRSELLTGEEGRMSA